MTKYLRILRLSHVAHHLLVQVVGDDERDGAGIGRDAAAVVVVFPGNVDIVVTVQRFRLRISFSHFFNGTGFEPGNSGDELTSTTSESMGHLEGIRTLVMIAMDQSK